MEENKELNLYQKLAKVRSIADVVVKEKSGYGYKYADLPSVLAKIGTAMKKYSISLVPSIVPGTAEVKPVSSVNTKVAKTGDRYDQTSTEMMFTAQMLFTWVNDDNPNEKLEVPWYVTGSQSDPSQALGSGMSYCTRYFLTNFFQIALIDNDVDAYRNKQKEAEESEARAITQEILKQVDDLIKQFVASSSDTDEAKKAVLGLTSKYVKGGNYMKIDNSNLAAKLLQEFKNTFLRELKEEK